MNISFYSQPQALYGQHTGYDRLIHHMRQIKPGTRVFQAHSGNQLLNQFGRVIGNHKIRPRNQKSRNLFEWYFYHVFSRRLQPGRAYHFLSFDSNYPFLTRWQRAPANLIFTLHNPVIKEMSPQYRAYLARLRSAIVLYRRDLPFFESIIGTGRVKYIQHGVDTEFFRPDPDGARPHQPRLLFIGRILRDTATLARLVVRLARIMPQIQFDFVVAARQRALDPHLRAIADQPAVTWHEGISDDQLRHLYQQSYLLLMPLIDAGANNSLVEALASGLPIVTNDVGGVPDYGGGSVFPTVAAADEDGMIGLIERYLTNPRWRDEIAGAQREMAVKQLAWPLIAQSHYETYVELCG